MQPPTDDPAVAAYVAGASPRAIARDLRISTTTLYRLIRRAGVPLRNAQPPRRGVPVYDEQGARRWESVAACARELRCTPHNLIQHHLAPEMDGYRLISRPHPRNVGRRWQGQYHVSREERPDA